jgi:hypothetical protein
MGLDRPMQNAIATCNFEQASVRMIMRDGEPWWVGIDAAAALGFVRVHKALATLQDFERGMHITPTPRGDQQLIVINESGFYSLLFRSKLPTAVAFKRWLTCEVLPSIRKHGCYPPPPEPAPLPIDTETPWDGKSKTLGQRFREERLRWEAEVGHDFAGTLSMFSKNVVRAIEDDRGGIFKGERLKYLNYRAFDVHYILNGTRALTDGEKRLRDAYRAADPVARTRLLQSAFALPAPIDPEQDFISQA